MASSRREFIVGSGAIFLSAGLIKTSVAGKPTLANVREADTIVIGAGVAGLSAARKLLDAGKSVIVIEARHRPGGRMWTDHSFAQNVPVELGAELIHGGPAENSLWPIVKKEKILTHQIEREFARYSAATKWVSANERSFYSFPLYIPQKPASFEPLKSDKNAEEYLTRLGIVRENRPLALLAATLDSEPFEKMDPSEISDEVSRLWQDFSDREGADEDSGDFKVTDGYDGVLAVLIGGMHIHLDTVVTRIQDNGSSVQVTARHNNEDLHFSAKNCVVTIPAPVLLTNTIEFIPALPGEKIAALRSGYSIPVAKIIMEFDRKILPLHSDTLDDFSQIIPCIWNASAGASHYPGQILVGWSTGDNARKLLSLTESDRYEHMLHVVRNVTGISDLMYQKATMHDWSRDPYSLGAYGYWDDEEGALETVGNIYWAGVVLSQINFAHDSGVKAARAILKSG